MWPEKHHKSPGSGLSWWPPIYVLCFEFISVVSVPYLCFYATLIITNCRQPWKTKPHWCSQPPPWNACHKTLNWIQSMRIGVESECGVLFSKGTLCSLCKLGWSVSSVGWTDTVSFDMDIAARAQSIILERQGSVSLHLSITGYPGNATLLDARVQQTWDPEDLSSRKSLPKGLRTLTLSLHNTLILHLWLLLNPLSLIGP